MTRTQLEHLIRACGQIVSESELIVIGSQSILGAIPDPPLSMIMSMEADIYPSRHAEKADEIDGAIGEGSTFHDTYGYYAQGVGPETATLPSSWRTRLHPIENLNTRGVRALCLDPHDLAIAKYVAGREKDLDFNREMARHGFTRRELLLALADELPVQDSVKVLVRARILRDFPMDSTRPA
ncbi:MAG: DUF6036 family nucleotidyltransferase [Solimonas sp.]